ncbi:hypothetical protein [Streptomyces sp. NPDC058812]|uniref:hypothetical protein n=1 Tax=unclassified Streptomyces TaxID=2593676 RepID=UPI0036C155D2
MYRAGDLITITAGALQGRTVEITAVRMYATDNGYYGKDVAGLLPPSHVTLARERAGGNPCGTDCTTERIGTVHTCDHCCGMCYCEAKRTVAARRF